MDGPYTERCDKRLRRCPTSERTPAPVLGISHNRRTGSLGVPDLVNAGGNHLCVSSAIGRLGLPLVEYNSVPEMMIHDAAFGVCIQKAISRPLRLPPAAAAPQCCGNWDTCIFQGDDGLTWKILREPWN